LTVNLQVIGTGPDPKGAIRMGWEGTATLKRSDFDVKALVPAVSDEVDLIIAVEAIKQ
jgi:polyisoprenoid-binding protein YceI